MRGILVVIHVTFLNALRMDRHRREAKEPELKALASIRTQLKLLVNSTASLPQDEVDDVGAQRTTWYVQEEVGWVGEGNIVPVGEHGRITSLRASDMTAVVAYPSATWRHYINELYKVVATRYGFEGGQRVEFIGQVPNGGNVAAKALGMVQAFHETEEFVKWWDLTQNIAFYVTPDWLAAPTPYSPVRGNGAWVGLYSVNAGGYKIWEKVGTTKTHEQTTTNSWAREVTSTLSYSMKAGVGFEGFSSEVSVGAELSVSLRQEHSNTQSYSWSVNEEEGFELTLPPNSGYLWQWHIRTELANGLVYQSKTRNFAVTMGLFQKPRCLPGYELDGAACQECWSEESTIVGIAPGQR